eukprot:COSAG04_NODE_14952_length_549_cov_0.682222_2_plen_61_part_01
MRRGLRAVATTAALPGPTLARLWRLELTTTPPRRGWVALAGALPSLPALQELHIEECPGLG